MNAVELKTFGIAFETVKLKGWMMFGMTAAPDAITKLAFEDGLK